MGGVAISVRFDGAALQAAYARMAKDIPVVLARALNQGGDKVRTQVQRALKTQTGVKAYSSITKRVTTIRAYPGNLSYQIVAHEKGMPIKEFPVTVTGGGVDAKAWGVDHLFARSFKTKDRGLLRARLPGVKRFPIRALYGPALPKELGHGESAEAFEGTVESAVGPAINRALAAVLGGRA